MSKSSLLQNEPTSIGSWVLLIAKAVEENGIDSRKLFKEAGLDLNKTRDANSRFPVAKMFHLWQLAEEKTKDPYLPLQLAALFQPSTYNALGLAIVSSENLLDALERCVRFYRLTTDSAAISLVKNKQSYEFVIEIPEKNRPIVADMSIEAWTITLIELFRHVWGQNFAPHSVCYEHNKNVSAQPYADYFRAPVTFGCERSKITFSAKPEGREILYSNPALVTTLDEWMGDYLAQFSSDLLTTKVKEYILQNLAMGRINQTDAAKALGLSVRSMQRKLKEEGTSYSSLLDDCRKELAMKYIVQVKVPLIEIVFMLGFTDQSNFARAFRRWTKVSPNKYRDTRRIATN